MGNTCSAASGPSEQSHCRASRPRKCWGIAIPAGLPPVFPCCPDQCAELGVSPPGGPTSPNLLRRAGPPRARFTLGTGARRPDPTRGRWSPAHALRRGAGLPGGPRDAVPLLVVRDAPLLLV